MLFQPVLPPRPVSSDPANYPGGAASRLIAAAGQRAAAAAAAPAPAATPAADAELAPRPVRALQPGEPPSGLGSGQNPGAAGRGHRRSTFLAGYRRQVAWMTVLTVLLLATAAGTAVALVRRPAPGSHGSQPPARSAGPGVAALARAAALRASAAQWVNRYVSHSVTIGCDTIMCAALKSAGANPANLLMLGSSTPDPLGADVVVVTPDLQAQFRQRLASEYAPAVLSKFGSGRDQIAVRAVAADGAAAYRLALSRDVAARDVLGTQLIGNSKITLPPSAKTQLATGQVDPRLLIPLPALASQQPVRVLGFYGRAPGASSGVPLTGVRLAGYDRQAGLTPGAYLRWILSFLRSQQSDYRAATVTTALSHGQTVVSVRFALPNVFGLLH
ncbi:MAG: hypothetical protein ACR2FU_12995 [Streptosporangiaceae bacterium]